MSRFTREQLLSMFEMRPDGVLIWVAPSKYHKDRVGKVAGRPIPNHNGKEYWTIGIGGKNHKRSRLVYCIHTGEWPSEQVDHIDGNSLNDAPQNLRSATPTQNAWNHKCRRKRSQLPMGVKALPSGKYQARIAVNHQKIALGSFPTPEAASTVYQQARKKYFGEFA